MTYRYMPAAILPWNMTGISIHTKFKNGPSDIRLLERDNQHYLISTPDRELMIVRNNHEEDTYRPLHQLWDEEVYFSMSSGMAQGLAQSMGMTHMMINYLTFVDKGFRTPYTRHPRHSTKDGIEVYADSGGFQLSTKRTDYIDPVDLALWYNDNADVGVSLDIPVKSDALRPRMAQIMKNMNEIMLDHIRPGLELCNVVHGNTEDIKTFYDHLKVVHNTKIKRIALAGIYYGTILDAIVNMTQLIEHIDREYPNHYTHIHLLGVLASRVMLPLIYIMNHKFPQYTFTSDSASSMHLSVNNLYTYQSNIDRPRVNTFIGYASHPHYKTNSAFRRLPCGCPICSAIKYMDVFSYSRGFMLYLLWWHNMLEMIRYSRLMDQLSTDLAIEDFRQIATGHISNRRRPAPQTIATFNFVEDYLNHGMAKASRRFGHWLTSGKTLFAHPTPILDDESALAPVVERGKVDHKFHDEILKKYESEYTPLKNKKMRPAIYTQKILNTSKQMKRGNGKFIVKRKRPDDELLLKAKILQVKPNPTAAENVRRGVKMARELSKNGKVVLARKR